MSEFEPSLPYKGTEGFAGSETSRARAQTEALNGVASKRQRYVLIVASNERERGITVRELRDSTLHHGRVSGALSVLHKEGRLARLKETRDRCKVYVLPEYINGRETEPHGVVHRADKETLEAAARVEQFLRRYEDDAALFDPPVEPDEDSFNQALWRLVNYAQGRA